MKNINKAFTLIELIVAIVIIGIILPTISRVIYVASKADDEEVKQCVIFETYKRMNRNYSAKWDDESNLSSGWTKIVNVANGDSELGFPSKGKRVGSVKGDTGKHRQYGYSHNASDILGLEIEDKQYTAKDIDDYIGDLISEECNTSMTFTTTVQYINDEADYSSEIVEFDFNTSDISATSTNIKMSQVEAKIDGKTVVKFAVFVSNIGEVISNEK